jgi:hypothetical protein
MTGIVGGSLGSDVEVRRVRRQIAIEIPADPDVTVADYCHAILAQPPPRGRGLLRSPPLLRPAEKLNGRVSYRYTRTGREIFTGWEVRERVTEVSRSLQPIPSTAYCFMEAATFRVSQSLLILPGGPIFWIVENGRNCYDSLSYRGNAQ